MTPHYTVHWESEKAGPFPEFDGELTVHGDEDYNAFWLVLKAVTRRPGASSARCSTPSSGSGSRKPSRTDSATRCARRSRASSPRKSERSRRRGRYGPHRVFARPQRHDRRHQHRRDEHHRRRRSRRRNHRVEWSATTSSRRRGADRERRRRAAASRADRAANRHRGRRTAERARGQITEAVHLPGLHGIQLRDASPKRPDTPSGCTTTPRRARSRNGAGDPTPAPTDRLPHVRHRLRLRARAGRQGALRRRRPFARDRSRALSRRRPGDLRQAGSYEGYGSANALGLSAQLAPSQSSSRRDAGASVDEVRHNNPDREWALHSERTRRRRRVRDARGSAALDCIVLGTFATYSVRRGSRPSRRSSATRRCPSTRRLRDPRCDARRSGQIRARGGAGRRRTPRLGPPALGVCLRRPNLANRDGVVHPGRVIRKSPSTMYSG